jgi:hypothetical protein
MSENELKKATIEYEKSIANLRKYIPERFRKSEMKEDIHNDVIKRARERLERSRRKYESAKEKLDIIHKKKFLENNV